MNKTWIIVVVVIILAVGTYFMFISNRPKPVVPEETPAPIETAQPSPSELMMKTISIDEQNESSESGTAILTEKDGKVIVTLNMTGAPSGVAQPVHIHVGSCPKPGIVTYPLTDVTDGKSETTIDVSLIELKAKLPLAINVHKSAAQLNLYVSCGDLSF